MASATHWSADGRNAASVVRWNTSTRRPAARLAASAFTGRPHRYAPSDPVAPGGRHSLRCGRTTLSASGLLGGGRAHALVDGKALLAVDQFADRHHRIAAHIGRAVAGERKLLLLHLFFVAIDDAHFGQRRGAGITDMLAAPHLGRSQHPNLFPAGRELDPRASTYHHT